VRCNRGAGFLGSCICLIHSTGGRRFDPNCMGRRAVVPQRISGGGFAM